jgi:hypothetical protein
MGGLACLIPWRAALAVEEFPAHPTHKELQELENGMRWAFSIPSIYEGVIAKDSAKAARLCELLAKSKMSEAELREAYEIGEGAYED